MNRNCHGHVGQLVAGARRRVTVRSNNPRQSWPVPIRPTALVLVVLFSFLALDRNAAIEIVIGDYESNSCNSCQSKSHSAHDHLLDKIPDRPGFYAWCNDAPALVEFTFGMLLDADSKDDIDEYLDELATRTKQGADTRSSEFVALQLVTETLQQLVDGIFDSEFLLCNTLSKEGIAHRSFIAHSSRSPAEMEQFMAGFAKLLDASKDAQGGNASGGRESPGQWQFEDGWLIYSDDQDELDLLVASMRTPPERPLSSNRSFERLFGEDRLSPEAAATMSLFVSDEVLRPYLLTHNPLPELFHVPPQEESQQVYFAAYLNEIRALGGRVFLLHEQNADRLSHSLATDLSVLVTEPRHGVLGAIRRRDGLRYDLPLLDRPIESLFEIEVDGRRLATGINDINRRLAPFSKYSFPFGNRSPSKLYLSWHSLDKFDGPTATRVLENAERFLSIKYSPEKEADDWRLPVWNAIELHERGNVEELITESLNENQLGSWAINQQGELTLWSISSDGAEKLKEGLEKELLARKESGRVEFDAPVRLTLRLSGGQIRQGENGGFVIDMNDLVEQMVAQYQERLSKYLDQAYVAVDDWLFVRPLAAHDLTEIADRHLSGHSTQMLDLQASVEQISRDFDVRPCGLLVNWSAHIQQKVSSLIPMIAKSNPQASAQPLTSGDRRDKEDSVIQDWQDRRQAWLQSLDKLVVLIEESPAGFRLVARVDRREPQDKASAGLNK